MNELVKLETLTPAKIFAPGGVDDILAKLKAEVMLEAIDISTDAGRKHVASLAYKVARSKTALDKMGKALGQEHYDSWKAITAERAKIEKELDNLRDEVRKPLTDFENAEKARIDCHENALASIQSLMMFDSQPTAGDIKNRIDALITARPRDWEEFSKRAADIEQSVVAFLNGRYEEATKREAEAAELARLRAEEIARQQKERDEKISAEAAKKARIDAEQKAARAAEEVARAAQAERDWIEQEKAAALAKSAQAEADKRAAAARAERATKEAAEAAEKRQAAAIEAERKRVADEAARVAAETARREADKAHRAKINNEALAAIVLLGSESELAKAIVSAIARGGVPHIKIEY
jgi:hypothetical protein